MLFRGRYLKQRVSLLLKEGDQHYGIQTSGKNLRVLVAQSCLLCNIMDCSPPCSSDCGILQAKTRYYIFLGMYKTGDVFSDSGEKITGFKFGNNLRSFKRMAQVPHKHLKLKCLRDQSEGGPLFSAEISMISSILWRN